MVFSLCKRNTGSCKTARIYAACRYQYDEYLYRSAKEILNAASARFTTLIPNNDLTPFLNSITSMPTTIFVDSQGNVIGKPIIGVPGREPAEVYVKTLSDLAEAH